VEELEKLPPTAWGLIAAAAILGFAAAWIWRWYRQYRMRAALRTAVTAAGSDHLVDMLVPDGMGGGFHVDFLLLTTRGILVIDLRDVQGNIFGGDQMAEWTVMDGPRRFTFTNPQSALYDRIAAVRGVAGEVQEEGDEIAKLADLVRERRDDIRAQVESTKAPQPMDNCDRSAIPNAVAVEVEREETCEVLGNG